MPGRRMQIAFVTHSQADKWPDLRRGDMVDPDLQPERFRSGVDVWIAQTYLQLRELLQREFGAEAMFTDRFVPGAICVAHRDDLNSLSHPPFFAFVVGVRADRPPICVADRVVIQNPLQEGTAHQHFVPLWPQPGLIPRDAARAAELRRVGYLGRAASAPAWFRDPAFYNRLGDMGIEFVIREQAWHDYSDLDAVVACRDEAPTMLEFKPATKLYNAWLAGVPALLGPEPAYRVARRSDLDYLEVRSAQDVIEALLSLKKSPSRYAAIAGNGLLRGQEYSTEAIRRRWLALFRAEVVPGYRTWSGNPSSVWRLMRGTGQLLSQKLLSRRFKSTIRRELQRLSTIEATDRRA